MYEGTVLNAVDDGIHLASVDADVVAHIAQFLGNGGVHLGIDVAGVYAGGKVIVVQCGLVAAHVTFVEQVEPAVTVRGAGVARVFVFGENHLHIVPATAEGAERQEADKCVAYVLLHISIVNDSL